MVKGNPLRIDETIQKQAFLKGEVNSRTQTEQIEHWAKLGLLVESVCDAVDIYDVLSGVASISITQKNEDFNFDSAQINKSLHNKAFQKELGQAITNNKTIYQASVDHPGLLERILPNGSVQVGLFKNGEFKECKRKISG